ncbi:hypothetical protein SO802_015736 [Lithocarpus litseifolius]|uniref:RNase H type-1 domain-containing protein n=1 Tax=Lithocarpus litseifolius TaxID=425828 RepID=A0AAW2CXT7_9ROSI
MYFVGIASFNNHNCEGKWLGGFVRGVGFITSSVAELWALRDGLNLASSLGIENLIVELDALAIVCLLRNSTANLALEPLLSDCRNLLRTFPWTRIEHVFREANRCVVALAKLGAKFFAMYSLVFLYLNFTLSYTLMVDYFEYFKVFKLLRRYLTKHNPGVNLEGLDFKAVDKEMETDEVDEAAEAFAPEGNVPEAMDVAPEPIVGDDASAT